MSIHGIYHVTFSLPSQAVEGMRVIQSRMLMRGDSLLRFLHGARPGAIAYRRATTEEAGVFYHSTDSIYKKP
jgi:hypothetical protein